MSSIHFSGRVLWDLWSLSFFFFFFSEEAFLLFFHSFVLPFFLIERDREHAQAGEKGRGRRRESQAGSTVSTEPNEGLIP